MMKRIILCLIVSFYAFSANSQQFLWSTVKTPGVKYVPIDSVEYELEKYFSYYQFYTDGSGYTKDGFVAAFEKSKTFKYVNKERWKEVKDKVQDNKFGDFGCKK